MKNLFDCRASLGASRILRVGSLKWSRFRSSFDSPAAARNFAFRFSSRESVAARYGERGEDSSILHGAKLRLLRFIKYP